MKYLCNNNRNILTVRKRFDKKLYNYLKDVSKVDTSTFKTNETPRNICYFNRTRKFINNLWNTKLKPINSLFIAENPDDEYTQDMNIYEGLPIIARKTEGGGDYCMNNETY